MEFNNSLRLALHYAAVANSLTALLPLIQSEKGKSLIDSRGMKGMPHILS